MAKRRRANGGDVCYKWERGIDVNKTGRVRRGVQGKGDKRWRGGDIDR